MSDSPNAAVIAPEPRAIQIFSIGRVWTIAVSTITHLIRMKIFYFLLVFVVLLLFAGNISFASSPAQALSTLKKVSFGALDLFAWVFAIVATALLIPRDIEDRTLYTILSKPVRRVEYLIGKLGGVLLVIAASLAILFVVSAVMIQVKEFNYISAEIGDATAITDEMRQNIGLIENSGFRPDLALAALASLMKAAVVAAVSMLLSTFASSSLFTIIVSMLVFLVGHAHNMLTNFWLYDTDHNVVVQLILKLFKVIIPNFQLFSFSEGIVLGEAVSASLIWQMSGLTGIYLVVFVLLSLLTFVDKEF